MNVSVIKIMHILDIFLHLLDKKMTFQKLKLYILYKLGSLEEVNLNPQMKEDVQDCASVNVDGC
jgi:hypothetical protein